MRRSRENSRASRVAARRRRRTALAGALSIVAAFCIALGGGVAQAVHDIGIFQLDGNATTAPTTPPPEDWDLICKAHQPTSTPAGPCKFAPGYAIPSGTTTASVSAFVVDPSQSAKDDILKGGTKDDNDINADPAHPGTTSSDWAWATAKPSPPKNDITDAYAAEYTCDPSAGCTPNDTVLSGDKILYFGADRFSNSGSANLAFWFFQKKITQLANGPNGTCADSSGCPFSGTHTEGFTDSNGKHHPGDILVISAFGPKAAIRAYEWVGVGNAPAPCFTNACSLVRIEAGGTCGAKDADTLCAITNATDSVNSPWIVPQKGGTVPNQILPTNFFEGGIDLTALHVDACFSSFLINTRASAAGDAELHDKAIGQLQRCDVKLTTQASTNGTVTPGTPVHDTATLKVEGAANPADPTGDVSFVLCGPIAVGSDCATGGKDVGTSTIVADGIPDDGVATVDSPTVNDSAKTGNNGPLAPGHYCFRAEWPGDGNYEPADPATNSTTECFDVSTVKSKTVTSPSVTTITLADINAGSTVTDTALVSPDGQDVGFPSGTVSFFICGPISSGTCDGTTNVGTAVTGNPVDLVPTAVDHTSRAVSGPVGKSFIKSVGRYCFRGEYSGDTQYEKSQDSAATECFTVTDTSSALSQQNWLPNDTFQISTAGGSPLTGTLAVTLRSGTCLGTVVFTEPTNTTLTGVASGTSFDTTNATFKVKTATAGTYFWRIVFTPTNASIGGVTKCETSTVTINDAPPP